MSVSIDPNITPQISTGGLCTESMKVYEGSGRKKRSFQACIGDSHTFNWNLRENEDRR